MLSCTNKTFSCFPFRFLLFPPHFSFQTPSAPTALLHPLQSLHIFCLQRVSFHFFHSGMFQQLALISILCSSTRFWVLTVFMDLSIFPQQNTRLDGVIDAHLCLLNGCFSSRDHNIGFHWIVFPKTLGLGDLALPALLCHLNNMPATPSLHRVPATRQHLCPKENLNLHKDKTYIHPKLKFRHPCVLIA